MILANEPMKSLAIAYAIILQRRMFRRLPRRFYVRPAHDKPLILRFRIFYVYYSSPGVPSLLIFQKSADFEMSNLAKSDFSVSTLIFEMRNFVKFIRNIMEN
jgi:hypothetical protein